MQAMSQIDLYEQWEQEGRVRIIKAKDDLEGHLTLWHEDLVPGLVLLMEGADPIVEVSDLSKWWQRGLRITGLTFGNTKYGTGVAGGSTTPVEGGLTEEGVALLKAMGEQGMIWDVTHLAEEGIWQGLDIKVPHVCASHANAQALTPTNRHLSDDLIKAIAEYGGVIGLVLYNGFLDLSWKQDKTKDITLKHQFKPHAEHLAKLVGWDHIGIGSDLDGGFGREESPIEIETVADLHKIGELFTEEVNKKILGDNWIRFLRKSLP
jgi:membrane dipeptidase